MTTDSTELTFVRCPSCRSLVPAVSTRCRMCGAVLESGDVSGEAASETGGDPSRVRQRTVAKPKTEDLNSAVRKLREDLAGEGDSTSEEGSFEEAPANGASEEEGFAAGADDPLSGYIEEIEEPASEESVAVEEPVSPNGDGAQEARGKGEREETQSQRGRPERGESSSDDSGPRVIVESGARRSGRPGLSFSRGDGDKPRESRPGTEHGQKERGKSEERESSREERRDRPAQSESGLLAREDRRREREDRPAKQQPPRPSQPSKEPERGGTKVQQPSVRGRLVGWLVSYSNPDGEAYELREGKFFVTGSKLKPHDLVLEDESVSVPHAMVTVKADKGIVVQDLMSDRGIFIRGGDADTYQREEDTIHAKHGDWIRFGDVEFLVCLIAHVGTK